MIRALFLGTDNCGIPYGKFEEVIGLLEYSMGRSSGSISRGEERLGWKV